MSEEKLRRLMKPTPKEYVSQRDGGGGRTLDYLEWSVKVALLSQEVPDWRWRLKKVWRDEDGWYAIGTLTVCGVSRDGRGFARHRKTGQEDNGIKDACSDALSHACSLFGIGLDLYGKGGAAEIIRSGNGDEPVAERAPKVGDDEESNSESKARQWVAMKLPKGVANLLPAFLESVYPNGVDWDDFWQKLQEVKTQPQVERLVARILTEARKKGG
jgi:hypothetical protein